MNIERTYHGVYVDTAKRQYHFTECFGVWYARFQPINPKTGYAWQAVRTLGRYATQEDALAAIENEIEKSGK